MCKVKQIENTVSQMKDAISSWDDTKAILDEEVKANKAEMCDMYHYIEFNDLNASDGFKAYKKFQEILRNRRRIKDSIEYINSIDSEMNSIKNIFSSIDDKFSNRQYASRVEALYTYDDADDICQPKTDPRKYIMSKDFTSYDEAATYVKDARGDYNAPIADVADKIKAICCGTKKDKKYFGWIWSIKDNKIIATRDIDSAPMFV